MANRAVVQRDGTLSLSDLQRDDGGLYTCTATNRHGHDSAMYHLNVLGKLQNNYLYYFQKEILLYILIFEWYRKFT